MSKPDRGYTHLVRTSYSAQAETQLRDMILSGSLEPGERLNEVALAEELGISRGPLREAVQRLTAEGLLTVVSHRGTFVRQFHHDEIVELYELRAALETYIVRLACRRASDEDLQELEGLLAETADRISGTATREYPTDLDFHARLVAMAENRALTRAWAETQQKITLARGRSGRQPIRARAALAEHTDLVRALRLRDVERAAAMTAEHLEHSMTSALVALRLQDEDAVADPERKQQ